MRLFVVRHADAEASSRGGDTERPLSATGTAEAETLASAATLLRLSLNSIFVSPLLRARQTAEIVGKKFPSVPLQVLEVLKPSSDPKALYKELQALPRDARVLIVSHEPYVSNCIASLISAEGTPGVNMKKASLACLEVGSPVQRGSGILLWLLTNEQLKLLKS